MKKKKLPPLLTLAENVFIVVLLFSAKTAKRITRSAILIWTKISAEHIADLHRVAKPRLAG